jgi:uncharacterized protein (DUF934 family)
MSTLIRSRGRDFTQEDSSLRVLADDEATPESGTLLLTLERFQTEGRAHLDDGRRVGVLLQPDDDPAALAVDLHRLCIVALVFPKFRDGRAYSSAMLLRTRLGFTGEIRAVGDVLREQAREMMRCGFDAFAPADGSTADQWAGAAHRYRHAYQRAADGATPAFEERSRAV